MSLVVAFAVHWVKGYETGIIDAPGFDSGVTLIDLFQADAQIRSFTNREEAEQWLKTVDAETAQSDRWD
ncbi:hypothetical protein [Kribbella catacumbae]|uniref:hypothetical protein n=1 Tax=Kribbella catacumbae TaxID=460086 RepID=UPI000377A504|nr:hypothetical protein [Kribbella catacumbae]